MLRSLHVRDYALIDELEVEFGPGLNVITGETGAGKSILLGALKLILGERASTEAIRTGAKKAVVEGVFDEATGGRVVEALTANAIEPQPSGVVVVRREVSATHSRAFVNDTPATLQVLRAVAEELIDLHGQHEHQSLLRTATHVDFVDAFGGLLPLRAAYRVPYDEIGRLRRQQRAMIERAAEVARRRELTAFQVEEIDRVAPQQGEEEALLAERRILEHAERLHQTATALADNLYQGEDALFDRLVGARNDAREMARIDPAVEATAAELAQACIAVEEAGTFLREYADRIEIIPERLEAIRERLAQLDALKRKYGGTLEAVLDHRRASGQALDEATGFQAALDSIDAEIARARQLLTERADALTAARRSAAASVEEGLVAELAALGMPDAVFEVRIQAQPDDEGWIAREGGRVRAFPHGADLVEFVISTNPGERPRPLARVASGGEVSRVMLALKATLARNERLPILVFDEIDVGVSGEIARRVGETMRRLAASHQIIAITHLPQIAALADHHFLVEKLVLGQHDARLTRTRLRKLTGDEHTRQVAALVAGEAVGEAALASARELIAAGRATS